MGNGRGCRHPLLHAAVVLLTLLGTASAYCKQGGEWVEYNGSCYHWTRTPINWFAAELACKRFGGHLVSIANPSENNFALRLTQCSNNFWIGMANTVSSQVDYAKGYEWWDGTHHNYTAFVAAGGNDRHLMNCVFATKAGSWNNFYCYVTSWGHVCKAPAVKPSQANPVVADNSEQGKGQPQDSMVAWSGSWAADVPTTAVSWPTSSNSSSMKCPSGWQLLDSSCYFVSANKTNYFNAQMSCQALGASVTSILTLREHTLLTVAIGCNSPMWIGLEKARPCFKQPSRDHCWVWMDRSPVNLFEWAPSQTLDRRDAECVILDGQWKVTNCYGEYGYICKKPAYGEKTSE